MGNKLADEVVRPFERFEFRDRGFLSACFCVEGFADLPKKLQDSQRVLGRSGWIYCKSGLGCPTTSPMKSKSLIGLQFLHMECARARTSYIFLRCIILFLFFLQTTRVDLLFIDVA